MRTETSRAEYNRRKKAGLCIGCPKHDVKPVKHGFAMCEYHIEYHRKKALESWRKKKAATKVCIQCPKTFIAPSSNKTQRFCSHACARQWQKDQRPKPPVIPKRSFETIMRPVRYENYQGIEGQFAL